MGWINSEQQKRDHNGQRDRCAADGRKATQDDPLIKSNDGWRIHRSHTTNPADGFYGEAQKEN